MKTKRSKRSRKKIPGEPCEKFDSDNGLSADAWGPHLWHYLHLVSLNYTVNKKKQYKCMLKYVFDTLPCGECRDNIKKHNREVKRKHFQTYGRRVWSSRLDFAYYMYRLHSRVNKELRKTEEPSFAGMCRNYLTYRRF